MCSRSAKLSHSIFFDVDRCAIYEACLLNNNENEIEFTFIDQRERERVA